MPHPAARHLTLLVPGLFGPTPLADVDTAAAGSRLVEGLSLPSLELLLTRAEPSVGPPGEAAPEALLCAAFGLERTAGADWPIAQLTHRLDTGRAMAHGDPRCWMRVDPVYLRADLGELVLFPPELLRIDRAEAQGLVSEIEPVLREAQGHLEAPVANRWYLRGESPWRMTTTAPSIAIGSRVRDHLPQGPDASRWNVLLNEVQMVLHASPVNAKREARGLAPINSIWAWGGGPLAEVSACRWRSVSADDPLARALALRAETPDQDLPASPNVWLESVREAGEHLVVLNEGFRCAAATDIEGWRQFLLELDRHWLAPMVEALRSRALESLTLRVSSASGYRLTRFGSHRWWRRARGFGHYVDRFQALRAEPT